MYDRASGKDPSAMRTEVRWSVECNIEWLE